MDRSLRHLTLAAKVAELREISKVVQTTVTELRENSKVVQKTMTDRIMCSVAGKFQF